MLFTLLWQHEHRDSSLPFSSNSHWGGAKPPCTPPRLYCCTGRTAGKKVPPPLLCSLIHFLFCHSVTLLWRVNLRMSDDWLRCASTITEGSFTHMTAWANSFCEMCRICRVHTYKMWVFGSNRDEMLMCCSQGVMHLQSFALTDTWVVRRWEGFFQRFLKFYFLFFAVFIVHCSSSDVVKVTAGFKVWRSRYTDILLTLYYILTLCLCVHGSVYFSPCWSSLALPCVLFFKKSFIFQWE